MAEQVQTTWPEAFLLASLIASFVVMILGFRWIEHKHKIEISKITAELAAKGIIATEDANDAH